jgi:hypothetical protein
MVQSLQRIQTYIAVGLKCRHQILEKVELWSPSVDDILYLEMKRDRPVFLLSKIFNISETTWKRREMSGQTSTVTRIRH